MKNKAVLIAVALFASLTVPAIPQICKTSDIKFNYRATGKDAWKKIYVINVVYPQLSYSVKSMEASNKLQKIYQAKKVDFFVLLPLKDAELQNFANLYNSIDLKLCADPELKELRRLLGRKTGSFSQTSIFNYAGKLLWSGDPIDLAMMLERITSGKYSEREEAMLSALTNSLQGALRSGNAKIIGEAADAVLRQRPEQLSAVNAKAYSLEISGNTKELEKFFRDRIQRFPQAKENYLMLIQAAYRLPEMSNVAPQVAGEFLKKFPEDAENINSIAWTLLTNVPFDAEAFKVVIQAEAILAAIPEVRQNSRILATRAITAHRRCDLPLAKKLTQTAVKKAADPSEKLFLEKLLQYFNTIQ